MRRRCQKRLQPRETLSSKPGSIRRAIVKVRLYNTDASVNVVREGVRGAGGGRGIRRLYREQGGERDWVDEDDEREKEENKVARYPTSGRSSTFISESDVTARHKGDSKSEQMAFIV